MKLTFKNDTFKILQIADTQEGRKVSPDTLALISAALDREEPDLVVYSGDQIWGRGFHGDVNQVRRVLKELTAPVVERHLPFAICFGNHDRQVGLDNRAQFEIYKEIPGFIGEDTPGGQLRAGDRRRRPARLSALSDRQPFQPESGLRPCAPKPD